jgi:hypothetical protein
MAALSASRYSPALKTFHKRLAAADKKSKVIIDVAAVHSPILLVTSPEPNSGKSTLLGVLSFLVRRSLQSVGITAAPLYRSIEKWQPTIIIDEADTAFADNDDLRSVVNSGWTRGQGVIRCDSETNEPRMFSTFCPKAIGMKGRKLPDTTMGRTIIIEMARKKPGERVTDFRYVDDDGLAGLRRKLARFAADDAERLRMAEPDMPQAFENRRAANWRLLLAIADSAKDETTEWGRSARQAAVKMSGIDLGLSPGIQLLADIKKAFEAEGNPTGISTKELIALLTNDPESRWCEFGRSRGHITQKGLAALLGKYNIISKTVRRPSLTDAKGYHLADFADAWARYLDPEAFRPGPSTSPETPSQDPFPPPQTSKRPTANESRTYGTFGNVPEGVSGRLQNDPKCLSDKHLDVWTFGEAEKWRERESGEQCAQCRGPVDGKERQVAIGDKTVRLHPECERFYLQAEEWKKLVGPMPGFLDRNRPRPGQAVIDDLGNLA